jgi:hypothetical protein
MNKKALSMLLCLLIATAILMNATLPFNVFAQQTITVYVNPQEQTVDVCNNFYVYVNIEGVEEPAVYDYNFFLYYDSSLMTPVNAWDGGFLQPPVTFGWETSLSSVHCWAVTLDGGSIGDGTLAVVEFHCDGPGDSELYPDVWLSDVTGMPFRPNKMISGFVHQEMCLEPYNGLYWKRSYTDYAPSGMPDFDQKQTGISYTWTNPNPPVGTPSWCGPTALANSFWWFDSEFEPNPIPPPTINDGFPLVQSYGQWDDHNKKNVRYLIEDLAWYIDTDGIRTQSMHCGTEVHEMAKGIDWYLNDKGLSDKFYVHLVKMPEFGIIEEELYKCQDVVLLLGYWQEDPPGIWHRIGGHFVTVAGINSTAYTIGLSDPYLDAAEAGLAPGVVIPPQHVHPPVDPWGLHNNATYVSHDIYTVYAQSPSPGGGWWIPDYPAYMLFAEPFYMWGNFPEEFLDFAGPLGVGPIHTEIEYAVIVCPWYAKPDYPDYVPSGVPDFDQRQGGTYIWQDTGGQWSHCGPVAVAGSLWWLDSEFEDSTTPPPAKVDTFPLVTSYNAIWDDHDPRNVPYLVEDLAWFMDTNGRRTGLVHSGTNVYDMEAGIAHYLSKVAINPFGDANGDGVVNQTDLTIVTNAIGSKPGDINWNLAADVNWTGTSYSKIDGYDVNTVLNNFGRKGTFYEQTIEQPDFYYLEEEFEKCEDVVLLLGFYIETGPGEFYWEGGHYVTWAGVDSADLMLAISNPIRDEAEQGKWGQIPVPHQHMPPEPPYIMHNDAQYVSHDIYKVAFNPLAGKWELLGYFDPPMHAFFDYAVITSPVSVPDVAVINVTTSKTGCVPMPTVCEGYNAYVKVTVENQGNFIETFNVTVYANGTNIGTKTVISLIPGAQTILTFRWNTTGFAKGNYTIKAVADTVGGETETEDNTFIDGLLKVVIVGDVNGDGWVEMMDFYAASNAFMSRPGDPNWNPNADIYSWPDGDGVIEMMDFFILGEHYMEHDP